MLNNTSPYLCAILPRVSAIFPKMTRKVYLNKQHTKWIETTDGYKPQIALKNGNDIIYRTVLYFKLINGIEYYAISYKGTIIDLEVGKYDITGMFD